jgi:hypothetical protein
MVINANDVIMKKMMMMIKGGMFVTMWTTSFSHPPYPPPRVIPHLDDIIQGLHVHAPKGEDQEVARDDLGPDAQHGEDDRQRRHRDQEARRHLHATADREHQHHRHDNHVHHHHRQRYIATTTRFIQPALPCRPSPTLESTESTSWPTYEIR